MKIAHVNPYAFKGTLFITKKGIESDPNGKGYYFDQEKKYELDSEFIKKIDTSAPYATKIRYFTGLDDVVNIKIPAKMATGERILQAYGAAQASDSVDIII